MGDGASGPHGVSRTDSTLGRQALGASAAGGALERRKQRAHRLRRRKHARVLVHCSARAYSAVKSTRASRLHKTCSPRGMWASARAGAVARERAGAYCELPPCSRRLLCVAWRRRGEEKNKNPSAAQSGLQTSPW